MTSSLKQAMSHCNFARSKQEAESNCDGAGEVYSSDGRSFLQNNHNPDTPQIFTEICSTKSLVQFAKGMLETQKICGKILWPDETKIEHIWPQHILLHVAETQHCSSS